MPIVKPSCIRDMKLRINVVDVISRVATLKKAGARYKGLCPFHTEKSPSFHVDPDKGFYKCFGCGKSGDIFTFVRETEQLSFTESVEALSERFGVPVEYEEGAGPSKAQRGLKQELFDIHDQATEYYHQAFRADTAAGRYIRDYWVNTRQFDLEVAEEFKIGVSDPEDDGLIALMLKRRYSEQALRDCGLFFIRDNAFPSLHTMRQRFRGRLMIPIRDHQSRVVAFTARQTAITPKEDPSYEAKYVNSPETPIFSKSHLLFNLDRARTAVGDQHPFVLVEGQLDAIRCWISGLKTAIAPQGTSITEPQLTLMLRYHSRVECFFDSDAAGRKAALRFLPMALKQGLECRFLHLDGEGKLDPDLLFKEQGLAAYERLSQGALSSMAFACKAIIPEPNRLSHEQKAQAAQDLFAIIHQADSHMVRNGFLGELADYLGLPPGAIEQDFARLSARLARQEALRQERQALSDQEPLPDSEYGMAGDTTPAVAPSTTPAKTSKPRETPELHLLLLILHFEEMGPRLGQAFDFDWIDTSDTPGRLLLRFLNEINHENWPGRDNLDPLIENSEERTLLASLLFDPPPLEDPDKIALEGLKIMRSRVLEPRLRKIELDLARLRADSPVDAISLIKERTELQRQLRQPIGLP